MPHLRVGFVTCRRWPDLTEDDSLASRYLWTRGVEVVAVPWDEPDVPWGALDAVVFRSCRDCHQRGAEFREWLERLEESGTPAWNPPRTIRWNMSGTYLRDLETAGVDTIPSVWVPHHRPVELSSVMEQLDCHELLVRPVMPTPAAGAWRASWMTREYDQRRFEREVACRDMVVQPVLPVTATGVWSVIYLGGRFSHVVPRIGGRGDPRAHPAPEGPGASRRPDPAVRTSAEDCLRALDDSSLYARIDVVEADGRGLVTELELIEPHLYLAAHDHAPRRFGEALEARLAGRS